MDKQLTLVLSLLWIACACPILANPQFPTDPQVHMLSPRLTPAEAAIAARVTGSAFQVEHRFQEQRRGRLTIGVNSSTVNTLQIDQQTGLVVEYRRRSSDLADTSSSLNLTSDEALTRAKAFLQTTGVTLDGVWTLTQNKFWDHGTIGREYEITWRRIFQGIELPAFISVSVDADDGQIISYMLVDDPVVIPLEVNITGEQALATVVEKKGWAHPIVKLADLEVWYAGGYPGPQVLMWRFEIANPDATTGGDSYVWAQVNATTGDILELGEPGGFLSPEMIKKIIRVSVPKIGKKSVRAASVPPTVFQAAARKKAHAEKAHTEKR